MDLVNDLGSDIALAILVEKKHIERMNSKEILSLITRVRDALEPVSLKDHSYMADSAVQISSASRFY